eukprot:PLAT14979.1.p1 GENE.PLAT14979.1~~PLAT14979.1.p1  ORF type:complete len:231 (+),score=68.60 PLAT14979.1:1-693(+)
MERLKATNGARMVEEAKEGWELIAQGAEAKLYRCVLLGRGSVVKQRFPKTYRHPELDARLQEKRLVHEARTLVRCRRMGVPTPAVLFVDKARSRLYMEDVPGRPLRQVLFDLEDESEKLRLCSDLGRLVADIHNAQVIHGDPTTSNFLYREPEGRLVAIDFGLSFASSLAEDMAVDLYVLERAFSSTHPESQAMVEEVLAAYGERCQQGKAVLQRLLAVRARGRKKLAFG